MQVYIPKPNNRNVWFTHIYLYIIYILQFQFREFMHTNKFNMYILEEIEFVENISNKEHLFLKKNVLPAF